MDFDLNDISACRDCPFPMKGPILEGGPEVPFPLAYKMPGFGLNNITEEQRQSEIIPAEAIIQVATIKVEVPVLSWSYVVLAVGEFASGGWKEAYISPRTVVVTPNDGIYDFDMVGERRPGDHTLQLTYMETVKIWHFKDDAKGIRVFDKQQNSKVAIFS